ncbi:MAG: carboxymuconolactone decarboxylase [Verrucomicrobia bacterium]|nr:carboxymuconolactone decarboxylase [Verrucomicrobiota bacterium]
MHEQSTFGRYAEIPFKEMTAEQREGYDYVMSERGMCPGPYQVWLENPPLMKLMVPVGTYYQKRSSLGSAEREIATTLLVAKWRAAFPVAEHEWISAKAGIPSEKIERMIIGLPVTFDDAREQIIYEITSALVGSRVVPKGLYERAIKLLGHNGLTDLTVLLGYYSMVAFTLMAYDVPSNAPATRDPE